MSQKRVMQLVISRIGQLNTILSRIENSLVDAFLDLAARADPEKTGLAAEDAELRAKVAPSFVLLPAMHEQRMAILERAGEQPTLVEAVRQTARSSAEWAALHKSDPVEETGHTRRSGKRASTRTGPQVPPRPANLKLDPSRRSGKNLNLSAGDSLTSVRSARSGSAANADAIPARSPHRPARTPRKVWFVCFV